MAQARECNCVVLKKYAISFAAVSAASEPCTTLRSMLVARSARMVPGHQESRP